MYNFPNDSLNYTGFHFIFNVNSDAGVQNCSAIISDSAGNYQFLTNGYTVLNKDFRFMKGMTGKCLISPTDTMTINITSGSHFKGAAMILPRPGHLNQYVILHFNFDRSNHVSALDKMYYSLVDMTADSGRGAVISLRNLIDTNNSYSAGDFAAVKHANGSFWWVFKKEFATNSYHVFLITDSSITLHHTQQIGDLCEGFGDLKMDFSPDGSKLAQVCATGVTHIFEFDRCSGKLSNPINFQSLNPHYPTDTIGETNSGAVFSQNSRFLYITQDYITWQYDLQSANIAASKRLVVDAYPSQWFFVIGQLAPDGKIYFDHRSGGHPYLGYIPSPDLVAPDCGFCIDCINLSPSLNSGTVPYFPNFRLKAALGYDTIGTNKSTTTCAGVPIYISTQPYKKHYSYQVSTDGTHYVSINSNEVPVTPTQTTTYYFRTTDNSIDSNCHRNYKVDTVVVNVLPSATNLYQADAGSDTSICPNKTVTLGAANNPTNLHYQWFAAGQQFSTESHPTVQPAATATYTLRITDPLIDTTCAIKRDTVTVTIEVCPIIIPTLLFNTFKITNLPENAALQLFDLLGRKVFESSNYQNDFDTRILSNGVYLFRFTDAGGSVKKGRVLVIN